MVIVASLTFFFVIFLAASILTAIAYLAFLKLKADASDEDRAKLSELREEPVIREEPLGEQGIGGLNSPLLQTERLSTITFWDTILARFDFGTLLKTHLDQADLDWSAGRITSMMLLIGVVTLAILMRLVPIWAALLGMAVAMTAPYNFVLRRRNKRFQKFREHFPDVLDSLARALRAGYPLSAAMEMIANETAQPVSAEMRRTSAEANLGRGWPHALESLGKRMPLLEVNLFIGAVQHRWHPDPEEHAAALADGVRAAAGAGARVVCLQELTLSPYFAVDPAGPGLGCDDLRTGERIETAAKMIRNLVERTAILDGAGEDRSHQGQRARHHHGADRLWQERGLVSGQDRNFRRPRRQPDGVGQHVARVAPCHVSALWRDDHPGRIHGRPQHR